MLESGPECVKALGEPWHRRQHCVWSRELPLADGLRGRRHV